ncbi:MAG: bifunctional glutamate N-acetyltransferase/amino-acid acetyltransferase ArgJ [Deltaproteobacteria bacterium]|nr:bifunctional glutamate N-acetyltransferase/amino-acid acetyltransferase ArgJ [Deltaproteobacteria bacterium]
MKQKILIPGFQFAGIHCGIKEDARKKDLSLIYSEEPETLIDGVFTKNRVCAAPVEVCRKSIRQGRGRLVVINSGIANACTGLQGLRDAIKTQREAARLFKLSADRVMVCSTGKIGDPLPMKRLLKGLKKAQRALSEKNFMEAARGMMTTDQFVKFGVRRGRINGKRYVIAVMTKGAGMLRPDMATLLTFIVTNLKFSRSALKTIFRRAVDKTLNRVTVDNDMSTNDTVLILANGRAGNEVFSLNGAEGKIVEDQITELLVEMAKKITLDGEGATKCCNVWVSGARNGADAKKIAYAVGNSPLVKTALFGCDPNWGRMMAAVGYSGAAVIPEKIRIHIGPYLVVRNGVNAAGYDSKEVSKYMRKKNIEIGIHLGLRSGVFNVYMSDLTYDYVHLNAEYHT